MDGEGSAGCNAPALSFVVYFASSNDALYSNFDR